MLTHQLLVFREIDTKNAVSSDIALHPKVWTRGGDARQAVYTGVPRCERSTRIQAMRPQLQLQTSNILFAGKPVRKVQVLVTVWE